MEYECILTNKKKNILKLKFIEYDKINNVMIYNLKIKDEDHDIIIELLMHNLQYDIKNFNHYNDYSVILKWKNIKDNLYEIRLFYHIHLTTINIDAIRLGITQKNFLHLYIQKIEKINNKIFKNIIKPIYKKIENSYKKHNIKHVNNESLQDVLFNINALDTNNKKSYYLFYNSYMDRKNHDPYYKFIKPDLIMKLSTMIDKNLLTKKEINTVLKNIDDLLDLEIYDMKSYIIQNDIMYETRMVILIDYLLKNKNIDELNKLIKLLTKHTCNVLFVYILREMIINKYSANKIYQIYENMVNAFPKINYQQDKTNFMINSFILFMDNNLFLNNNYYFNNIITDIYDISLNIENEDIFMILVFILHLFRDKFTSKQIDIIINKASDIVEFKCLKDITRHLLSICFKPNYISQKFDYNKVINTINYDKIILTKRYPFQKLLYYIMYSIIDGNLNDQSDNLVQLLKGKFTDWDILIFLLNTNNEDINVVLSNALYNKYNVSNLFDKSDNNNYKFFILNYNDKLYKFLKYLIKHNIDEVLNEFLHHAGRYKNKFDENGDYGQIYKIENIDNKYILILNANKYNENRFIYNTWTTIYYDNPIYETIYYSDLYDYSPYYRKSVVNIDTFSHRRYQLIREIINDITIHQKYIELLSSYFSDESTKYVLDKEFIKKINKNLEFNINDNIIKIWLHQNKSKKMSFEKYVSDSNIKLCSKKYKNYKEKLMKLWFELIKDDNYSSYKTPSNYIGATLKDNFSLNHTSATMFLLMLLYKHNDFIEFTKECLEYYEKKLDKYKEESVDIKLLKYIDIFIRLLKTILVSGFTIEYLSLLNSMFTLSWEDMFKLKIGRN